VGQDEVGSPPGTAVPRAVRALWGEGTGNRRGPKPALSVRAIAEAAIAIADTEGLGAASMSAVAKRLGFTTMSLYRHVDSKEDLQLAMVDVALGPPPDLPPRHGWRRQLVAWARAEHARMLAHPWVLEIRLGSPPLGPNSTAWMELGLRTLARTGLSWQQAASALLLVDGYARTQALLAVQFADADGLRLWADRMRTLVDAERHPALGAAIAAGVFDDAPAADGAQAFPSDEFDFGLGLVIDGIAELARA